MSDQIIDIEPVAQPASFKAAISQILRELDPEPDREGLQRTPERVEKAFRFYCQGYE